MLPIKSLHSKIEELINQQDFKRKPIDLYEPIAYTMRQGGKRLRPTLTLLACDLFGGKIEDALYPALAVEVFHNFTLVHDDIMDKAPLRRGMETVYRKWNADIAILSGDTMFAMAYQYALQTEKDHIADILRVFSKAAIEVCEGQQMDMNFESANSVSIDAYINMIRLKTAVLLGTALEIGAIIGRATPEDTQKIYDFGTKLGIAFQLMDDLLDVYGSEKFGKVSGGDIATNKKTILYIKALELANSEQRKQLTDHYNGNGASGNEKVEAVKAVFSALGIEKHVGDLMESYYRQAQQSLDAISVEESRKAGLRSFADSLYKRTY